MNKRYNILAVLALFVCGLAFAGNPDRQGEAGAYELLINPWARSAGLHTLSTSCITGVEAMGLNVAGLARMNKMEFGLANTRYIADMQINALGFGTKVGNSAFGFSLNSVNFGSIETTTTDSPEGTGATYSPSFFTLGLSFSHKFENKVSVGLSAKFVNESISNVAASGVALDAGVQYVTGVDDRFKFGISLRNIGTRMEFKGEGLSQSLESPTQTSSYNLTYYTRPADFELPSQLNIGASYDWPFGTRSKVTLMGNFTSNAFSQDQVGGGVEFKLNDYFSVRGAYKTEMSKGTVTTIKESIDNGVAAGLSASFPIKRGSDRRAMIDYAFRSTAVFNGIHNISLTLSL